MQREEAIENMEGPGEGRNPPRGRWSRRRRQPLGMALPLSPCLAAAVLAALGGLSVHSTSCCLEARPPGVKGRLGTGRLVWDREMEGLENWGGAGWGGSGRELRNIRTWP